MILCLRVVFVHACYVIQAVRLSHDTQENDIILLAGCLFERDGMLYDVSLYCCRHAAM